MAHGLSANTHLHNLHIAFAVIRFAACTRVLSYRKIFVYFIVYPNAQSQKNE